MFKAGGKAVFVGTKSKDPKFNRPNINEVVVLGNPCTRHRNAWDVVGYEMSKEGKPQSFHESTLRPL